MLEIGEPGSGRQFLRGGGEVQQLTAAAHVLGHRDQQPLGAEHREAGRVDLRHRRHVGVAAGVPEVGPVG